VLSYSNLTITHEEEIALSQFLESQKNLEGLEIDFSLVYQIFNANYELWLKSLNPFKLKKLSIALRNPMYGLKNDAIYFALTELLQRTPALQNCRLALFDVSPGEITYTRNLFTQFKNLVSLSKLSLDIHRVGSKKNIIREIPTLIQSLNQIRLEEFGLTIKPLYEELYGCVMKSFNKMEFNYLKKIQVSLQPMTINNSKIYTSPFRLGQMKTLKKVEISFEYAEHQKIHKDHCKELTKNLKQLGHIEELAVEFSHVKGVRVSAISTAFESLRSLKRLKVKVDRCDIDDTDFKEFIIRLPLLSQTLMELKLDFSYSNDIKDATILELRQILAKLTELRIVKIDWGNRMSEIKLVLDDPYEESHFLQYELIECARSLKHILRVKVNDVEVSFLH